MAQNGLFYKTRISSRDVPNAGVKEMVSPHRISKKALCIEKSKTIIKLTKSGFFFFNPHPSTCSRILDREKGRERNISRLPPTGALIRDRTHNLGMCPDLERSCNLLVYGWMLQPTELPGQGKCVCFLKITMHQQFYLTLST